MGGVRNVSWFAVRSNHLQKGQDLEVPQWCLEDLSSRNSSNKLTVAIIIVMLIK